MACGIHAVTDAEVAADHVGAHGGILSCKRLIVVFRLGLVFAVVDADNAAVPSRRAVGFIQWIWPVTTLAKTWIGH